MQSEKPMQQYTYKRETERKRVRELERSDYRDESIALHPVASKHMST